MRITPGTDVSSDVLGQLELFEGLTDKQLDWIRKHSERMEVAADEIIARPADPADHMYILLTGSFQWKFGVGGQNTVFNEARRGAVGGMLPFSRATKNTGAPR